MAKTSDNDDRSSTRNGITDAQWRAFLEHLRSGFDEEVFRVWFRELE